MRPELRSRHISFRQLSAGTRAAIVASLVSSLLALVLALGAATGPYTWTPGGGLRHVVPSFEVTLPAPAPGR